VSHDKCFFATDLEAAAPVIAVFTNLLDLLVAAMEAAGESMLYRVCMWTKREGLMAREARMRILKQCGLIK
jgi:hypothetical protein